VENEISILKSLKHDHILQLYDVVETDEAICVVLELASGKHSVLMCEGL
jgi:serine/threonine protein kinase